MTHISDTQTNNSGDTPTSAARYMTVDEVAEYLRCSVFTVRNYIKQGMLPGTAALKKRYLIPRVSVERLVEERAQ